jgi:hypothetical protein
VGVGVGPARKTEEMGAHGFYLTKLIAGIAPYRSIRIMGNV